MAKAIFINAECTTNPFQKEFARLLEPLVLAKQIVVVFGLRELEEAAFIIQGQPALLLIAVKELILIGPNHTPGRTACFSCLLHWLTIAGFNSDEPAVMPDISEARLAADLVTLFCSEDSEDKWDCRNTIHTFALSGRDHFVHPIYPLQDCRVCSLIKPLHKYELRIHCSPFTGIVKTVSITSTPRAGAYRARATWNSPLSAKDKKPLLRVQESHGRGTTRENAELGCIGEALERYSLVRRGDEPLHRARLAEVRGIDPRRILLYSDLQYETRDQWNSTADDRYFVGERFDPNEPIEWLPAVDLTDGSSIFVPAACTLMWYMFSASEKEYARADSIGCGSGWTFEDALEHALLEWIERDAMAIWWYNRLGRPAICLDSLNAPELLEVREGLRRIDRDLVILDCTTDIGVPAYISIAARTDGTEPLFAGAAHPSPRVAAWKAASEVGQLWFTIVQNESIDIEMKSWLENTIHTQQFLKPTHIIDAPPEPAPMSAGEQVRLLVGRLESVGLTSYAVDLSRSDVVLKTARAIVPGLRHIWSRRAPGRLYDVPVRLGWLKEPLRECELNPICCMI
jgi:ribosomal protein S12 methylthiotransferase accessory factor